MSGYWLTARSLAVAMFAFAVYLFLLWARERDRRRDLALALLFVVLGLYDVFVSKVYAGAGPEDAIPWLRLLSAADNLAAPLFLWYLAEYTGLVSRRALAAWALVFSCIALAEILAPGDIAWVRSRPVAFDIKLPFLPKIVFKQVASGPLGALAGLAGMAFIAYCIVIVRRFAASGRRSESRGFAAVIIAVFIAILNDTLVGSGFYRFLFLTEYAWAAVLVFLTYRSSDDILAGAEAVRRLGKSEARLRAMVEHVPFNIWMCDTDGRLILQNAADVATVGNHVGELYSNWTTPGGELSHFAEMSRRALAGSVVDETLAYDVAGEMRFYRDIIAPALSGPSIIGSVGIGIDITGETRAKSELEARLAEKEVLLREIHHRVKNNLQVIASLVSLRAEGLEDERSKAAFLDVQRQVYAIAHVHESLYLSDNLATIDFGDHVRNLAIELLAFHGRDDAAMALDVESLKLGIETAIPCALIANELITNAIKHALKDRREGRLSISLRRLEGGEAVLAVEDDGSGIPEVVEPGRNASLGMVLVSSLASQLRGRLIIGGERRNRVELVFPL
jgi:two-component sensor histidine kinase/PAS domain-containing protein